MLARTNSFMERYGRRVFLKLINEHAVPLVHRNQFLVAATSARQFTATGAWMRIPGRQISGVHITKALFIGWIAFYNWFTTTMPAAVVEDETAFAVFSPSKRLRPTGVFPCHASSSDIVSCFSREDNSSFSGVRIWKTPLRVVTAEKVLLNSWQLGDTFEAVQKIWTWKHAEVRRSSW